MELLFSDLSSARYERFQGRGPVSRPPQAGGGLGVTSQGPPALAAGGIPGPDLCVPRRGAPVLNNNLTFHHVLRRETRGRWATSVRPSAWRGPRTLSTQLTTKIYNKPTLVFSRPFADNDHICPTRTKRSYHPQDEVSDTNTIPTHLYVHVCSPCPKPAEHLRPCQRVLFDTPPGRGCVSVSLGSCAILCLESSRKSVLSQERQTFSVRTFVHEERSVSKVPQSVKKEIHEITNIYACLLYTSPSPRDRQKSRMPSSA